MRLFAAALLALGAAGCGAASHAGPRAGPTPCAVASSGVRLTSLHGQGTATTARFHVCGGWSADLDWRCPQVSEITTVAVSAGRRLPGPFGDGLVGMNIVFLELGGDYRFEVTAPAACQWSIDVDAGRV